MANEHGIVLGADAETIRGERKEESALSDHQRAALSELNEKHDGCAWERSADDVVIDGTYTSADLTKFALAWLGLTAEDLAEAASDVAGNHGGRFHAKIGR